MKYQCENFSTRANVVVKSPRYRKAFNATASVPLVANRQVMNKKGPANDCRTLLFKCSPIIVKEMLFRRFKRPRLNPNPNERPRSYN